MKREIKFRGKSVDNNEWVYGDLIHIGNGCIIYQGSQSDYEITNRTDVAIELFDDEVSVVRPETLGQFTGLRDKSGKEIYEGDIVECNGDICKVMYSNHYAGFALDKKGWLYLHFFGEAFSNKDCLVIGNIHDNIELLKENNYE
jgi:uncharacterized phage protein (TIGR01671 family)